MGSVYDFDAKALDGEPVAMARFSGDVLLIVNTASKCGFTPQYEGLEKLYQSYKDRGFAVLGFPCNQFGSQEPGTAEDIAGFCSTNYHVTFPMFAKIDVNGSGAHPLFQYLKQQMPGLLGASIKWNFTKFLIDRKGKVTGRHAPTTTPQALRQDIEELLAAPAG